MSKKKRPISSPRGIVIQPLSQEVGAPVTTSVPQNDKPQLLDLVQKLEKDRGTRVITYWTADLARISDAVIIPLYDQLSEIGKTTAIDLFLYTRGGDTEVPWRIVSLIREFCDRFSVLVPHRASSSGTLIALGADEIVMSSLGVLGPIDPSRTHPLLPRREGAPEAEPISVQDMRHAMQFIRETARPNNDAPYTAEAMAQIVMALFDKIHPLAIGAIEQSYALAKLIATQCLKTHVTGTGSEDQIKHLVDQLCDGYNSHGYQIGRKEAKEIGLKVTFPSVAVEQDMMNLFKFYSARPIGVPVKPTKGQQVKMYIAWLDSTVQQLRVEAEAQVGDANQLITLGDRWIPY